MGLALFVIVALFTLGGAVGVVATRNVVHAALFLLLSLLGAAGAYLLLFAEFLALVQTLIYGGAVTIVVLFAVMLTRSSEYPRITDNRQWPLGAAHGGDTGGDAGGRLLAGAGRRAGRGRRAAGAGLLPDWRRPCSPNGRCPLKSPRWCCWWP